MARWDELSAVLALCLAIFAILPNLHLLRSLGIALLRRLPIRANQCPRLLWEDIPDGMLHECSALTPYICDHRIHHAGHKVRCWEDLFSVVFSKAWAKDGWKAKSVKKPEDLPLMGQFVQIDFIILMAFIISTVGCNEELGSLMWGFSTYTTDNKFVFDAGGAQRLYLKRHDQCLVVHLFAETCRPWTPSGDQNVRSWSKSEIENLLDGYPPYYSETIVLQDKTRVAFPIHCADDLRKGGWVLAVKLGKITRPLPFYFESLTSADAHRKPTFQLATEWVREVVVEPFTNAFPGNQNVIAASNALKILCQGQEYIECKLEGSDLNEESPYTLASKDVITAMDIFNRPTRMNTSQRADLRTDAESILVPLLSAAVFGVRDVLRFEKKCMNLKERLPATLRPTSQLYVRDCVRTGFDASRRYPRIDIRQKQGL